MTDCPKTAGGVPTGANPNAMLELFNLFSCFVSNPENYQKLQQLCSSQSISQQSNTTSINPNAVNQPADHNDNEPIASCSAVTDNSIDKKQKTLDNWLKKSSKKDSGLEKPDAQSSLRKSRLQTRQESADSLNKSGSDNICTVQDDGALDVPLPKTRSRSMKIKAINRVKVVPLDLSVEKQVAPVNIVPDENVSYSQITPINNTKTALIGNFSDSGISLSPCADLYDLQCDLQLSDSSADSLSEEARKKLNMQKNKESEQKSTETLVNSNDLDSDANLKGVKRNIPESEIITESKQKNKRRKLNRNVTFSMPEVNSNKGNITLQNDTDLVAKEHCKKNAPMKQVLVPCRKSRRLNPGVVLTSLIPSEQELPRPTENLHAIMPADSTLEPNKDGVSIENGRISKCRARKKCNEAVSNNLTNSSSGNGQECLVNEETSPAGKTSIPKPKKRKADKTVVHDGDNTEKTAIHDGSNTEKTAVHDGDNTEKTVVHDGVSAEKTAVDDTAIQTEGLTVDSDEVVDGAVNLLKPEILKNLRNRRRINEAELFKVPTDTDQTNSNIKRNKFQKQSKKQRNKLPSQMIVDDDARASKLQKPDFVVPQAFDPARTAARNVKRPRSSRPKLDSIVSMLAQKSTVMRQKRKKPECETKSKNEMCNSSNINKNPSVEGLPEAEVVDDYVQSILNSCVQNEFSKLDFTKNLATYIATPSAEPHNPVVQERVVERKNELESMCRIPKFRIVHADKSKACKHKTKSNPKKSKHKLIMHKVMPVESPLQQPLLESLPQHVDEEIVQSSQAENVMDTFDCGQKNITEQEQNRADNGDIILNDDVIRAEIDRIGATFARAGISTEDLVERNIIQKCKDAGPGFKFIVTFKHSNEKGVTIEPSVAILTPKKK